MKINQGQAYLQVESVNKPKQIQSSDIKKEQSNALSPQQMNKKQLNAAILQGALAEADKSGNRIKDNPLSLVLKTALQGINDALQEIEPTYSLQQTYGSGIDFSPEATAERIVTFSTNFFNSYQQQHPELAPQQARDSFADLMLGGVMQGVGEAKDILQGLSALQGDVASDIEKTMEFIVQGFDKFKRAEQAGLATEG